MGKWCLQASSFIFDRIFVKLAGNQDRHKTSNEFEFRPERISHLGVCPWGQIKFSIDLLWNLQVQLTFQMKIYLVPCGRNSSYSFPPIVLKLFRCFLDGMKMCMWFGYNPLIIFSHFLAHLSRRLTRWAYRMGLEPASVWRASVRACIHTFKHEYLRDQQADYNQILSEASLGWGKGCIRFWCRSDQNSGFHGNG